MKLVFKRSVNSYLEINFFLKLKKSKHFQKKSKHMFFLLLFIFASYKGCHIMIIIINITPNTIATFPHISPCLFSASQFDAATCQAVPSSSAIATYSYKKNSNFITFFLFFSLIFFTFFFKTGIERQVFVLTTIRRHWNKKKILNTT